MTSRLRILYVVPYYAPAWAYGGSVRAAYELTWRLAKRGHDIMVYTTDALDAEQRAPAGEHVIDQVRVRRVKTINNGLAWRRLFVTLKADLPSLISDFDVVHLQETRTLQNLYALPGLFKHKKPYIIMPQGSLPAALARSKLKWVYDRLFGNNMLAKATKLHALTEMEREQYLKLGLPNDKIVVLPNGIEVNAYDIDADPLAFRHAHNIPAESLVVGFFARINVIKGPEFLARAFAKVLQQYPNAVLVYCGPDDGALTGLETEIEQLGIGESVRFTGFIDGDKNKAAAYRAFDVYVLPSRYEIQGITISEALLNRTPVITTDRCGLAVPLSEADVLDTVMFDDDDSLAQVIADVFNEPAAAKARAERGRQYVTEHFNWDALASQWEHVYADCIATI